MLVINKCLGVSINPEKVLLSSYYLRRKHVQVVMDLSSFTNTKSLQVMMMLPEMIYSSLEPDDQFGLRVFKPDFKPSLFNHHARCAALVDVIGLEKVAFNSVIKRKIFK